MIDEIADGGKARILRVLLAQTGILACSLAPQAADRDPWVEITDLSYEGRDELAAAHVLISAIAERMG